MSCLDLPAIDVGFTTLSPFSMPSVGALLPPTEVQFSAVEGIAEGFIIFSSSCE